MAAVAVTFARYGRDLTGSAASDALLATSALAVLTAVNCFGVRAGSAVQSALMVTKIAAVLGLVAVGLVAPSAPVSLRPVLDRPPSLDLLTAVGAALVPVLFAYGGWQTSGFVAGELKRPERDLPRGLLLGVAGVVVLYLSVNLVCVRVLGARGLADTLTPASAVMRTALGERGAAAIALGIAVSTLGFLSQGILTAPRVYYAMARDGLFFGAVARVHPRTRVPVVAIVLQGLVAIVIALSGRYEQILNYVVSVDFIFFGVTAASLFVFRRRGQAGSFRTPGHPVTTVFFVFACAFVVSNAVWRYPGNTVVGLAILAAGVPAYLFWRART
jgi:APA family basic amino acid/polyamine antiporter